jgi:hypothetical protein
MINKRVEEIKESNLQALIDNKVFEGKTIEYKRELPNNSDPDKKEFLADITSFANGSGGDLIFGIEQDNQTGEPKSLNGIEVENIDKEKTRLDNIIRSGVEPRILSVAIQPIPLSNSNSAVLIRIPKSWIGPHRVIFGGHSKFYARNSSGKYEMDVDELRIAFNLSETFAERIRNFRADRVAKILAGETPVPLYQNPKIVLHLIPVNAFNPSQKYNIDDIYSARHDKLPLIHKSVLNGRYNLDGLFTYSDNEDGIFSAYTQLYRNGIIEAVDALMLKLQDNKKILPYWYEEYLITGFNQYLKLLSELSVVPPVFIFLSLLGIRGYKIGRKNIAIHKLKDQHPIDRDLLLLPEAIINNYNVDAKDVLRPLFDLIWNACGFQRSLNFDEDGNWIAG